MGVSFIDVSGQQKSVSSCFPNAEGSLYVTVKKMNNDEESLEIVFVIVKFD